MGTLDATRLAEPLSTDMPCGPDLDADGDPDYLQCLAFVEGLLPLSFFTRDEDGRQQIFDRTTIDFPAVQQRVGTLLERTRDLRLLTLYGRLATLNRDVSGLAGALEASATLLRDRWEEVHPRGEDGDFTFRGAILQAFDDIPTVVLPLQHIALAESRRHGSISFRTVMVANGEAAAPNDDAPVDRGAIERALSEADIEALQTLRRHIATVEEAVGTIKTVSIANAGYGQAVSLDRLGGLAERIRALLDPVIGSRTGVPVAAAEAETPPASAPAQSPPAGNAGRIANAVEACAALAAATRYLRRAEPSSPAEVLVRQAQMLVGKSFLEVMTILVPDHAETATIAIGTDRALQLSFNQLAAVPPDESPGFEGVSDSDQGESAQDQQAETDARTFQIRTRQETVDALREVGLFYRSAEPSSPIPLLLDRARGLLERDFLSILKDVLPGLSGFGHNE